MHHLLGIVFVIVFGIMIILAVIFFIMIGYGAMLKKLRDDGFYD